VAVLKAMVVVADSTVDNVTAKLTLTQFHALRTVTERTPVTMGRVAQELAMSPSSVTRACEKLVTLKLLQRARNPLNKREILLAPTAKGRQVVERVDEDRRAAFSAILHRLDPAVQAAVTVAFEQFLAAVALPKVTSEPLDS
jgi:DNA-binding MarR family transcriptional regulator